MNEKVSATHSFNNMNLPVSMDPRDYGTILVDNYVQVDGNSLHRFIVSNGSRTYRIDISDDNVNHVTILGNIDLSWVDTRVSNSGLEILTYFIFVIPGTGTTPEQFIQYNWFNQSLIDFKLQLIDIFNNNIDKGGGSTGSTGSTTNTYLNSNTSTPMPNTPKPLNNILTTSKGTQTNLNGIAVSKMVETINILGDVLPEEGARIVSDAVTKNIKTIKY